MRTQLLCTLLLLLLSFPVSSDSGGGDSGGGGSDSGGSSSSDSGSSGGTSSCTGNCPKIAGIVIGSVMGSAFVIILVCCICHPSWFSCCSGIPAQASMANVPKTDAERQLRIGAALSTTVQFPPRTITSCRKGHNLVSVSSDRNRYLSADAWQKCNCCGGNFLLRNGSWRCESCDFDICPSCKSPQVNETLKYPTCKQGHALVRSVYYGMYSHLPYYGGHYQCNACFLDKSCSTGRWFCVFCLVDVCDECQKREQVVQIAPVLGQPVLSQPIPPELAAAAATVPVGTAATTMAEKGLTGGRCCVIEGEMLPPPYGYVSKDKI